MVVTLLDRASSVVSLFLFEKFIHKRFRHPTKKAIQPFTKKAPYLRTVFTNDSAFHQEDDSAIHVFAYLRIQSTDYSAITEKAIFFFPHRRTAFTNYSVIHQEDDSTIHQEGYFFLRLFENTIHGRFSNSNVVIFPRISCNRS